MLKARSIELAKYSLTPRQAAILQIAHATGGDVSAYKIARWIILEPHSLVKVLYKMEKEGLVKRSKRRGVRKESKIDLTEKGIKALSPRPLSIRGLQVTCRNIVKAGIPQHIVQCIFS